jgi:hypothetical protein
MPAARSPLVVTVSRSSVRGKKWTAAGSSGFRVHFGAVGYQDYTQHKDPERMRRYLVRHRARENWAASGMRTAGFWSRWLLWNKPSLRASAADISRRFNVRVRLVAG